VFYSKKSDTNLFTVDSTNLGSNTKLNVKISDGSGADPTQLSFVVETSNGPTFLPYKSVNKVGDVALGANFNGASTGFVSPLPNNVYPGNAQIRVDGFSTSEWNVEVSYALDAQIDFKNNDKLASTPIDDVWQVQNYLITKTKSSTSQMSDSHFGLNLQAVTATQLNLYICSAGLTTDKKQVCTYWKSHQLGTSGEAVQNAWVFNQKLFYTTKFVKDSTTSLNVYRADVITSDTKLPQPFTVALSSSSVNHTL